MNSWKHRCFSPFKDTNHLFSYCRKKNLKLALQAKDSFWRVSLTDCTHLKSNLLNLNYFSLWLYWLKTSNKSSKTFLLKWNNYRASLVLMDNLQLKSNSHVLIWSLFQHLLTQTTMTFSAVVLYRMSVELLNIYTKEIWHSRLYIYEHTCKFFLKFRGIHSI